ncbi:MAG: CPBP family intramembrane glutamate endopeptidase [Eggerthella lenta]
MRTAVARNHRAAVFVAALVATACCFSLVPGDTPRRVARAGRGAAASRLRLWRHRGRGLCARRAFATGAVCSRGPCTCWPWVWLRASRRWSCNRKGRLTPPLHVMQVAALCLLTAVFEEGALPGAGARCVRSGAGRRPTRHAASGSCRPCCSACCTCRWARLLRPFAADFVAVAQAACKPVQAALFGLFMAAMYFGTRNLWTLVAVHAAFNFLYAGPQLLAGNLQQTYVTGDPIDFVLLAVSTALLLPAAHAAFRSFRKNSKNV